MGKQLARLHPEPPPLTWRQPIDAGVGSELRRRMVQDMRLRNLVPKTQQEYLRWAIKFSEFHGKSPAALEPEDIRHWLVHLLEKEKKSPRAGSARALSGTGARHCRPPVWDNLGVASTGAGHESKQVEKGELFGGPASRGRVVIVGFHLRAAALAAASSGLAVSRTRRSVPRERASEHALDFSHTGFKGLESAASQRAALVAEFEVENPTPEPGDRADAAA